MEWLSPEPSAEESQQGAPASRRSGMIWNVLTILVLIGIFLTVVTGFLIYRNPNMLMNPFPPPTMPVAMILPTSTPTPKLLPPTWTVSPTVTLTATLTPPPAIVPTDAVEVTEGPIAATEDATPEPGSRYAFVLQGEVKAIDATIFRPEHGCKWMGVAGQTFDMQGRPTTGIRVQVGGNLGYKYIDLSSLTGTALTYGEAGFEVFLTDTPTSSKNTLWLRLLDQSDLPLSGKVYFSTSEDCSKNLVVINFKQVR